MGVPCEESLLYHTQPWVGGRGASHESILVHVWMSLTVRHFFQPLDFFPQALTVFFFKSPFKNVSTRTSCGLFMEVCCKHSGTDSDTLNTFGQTFIKIGA